jgi:hypothetical protein
VYELGLEASERRARDLRGKLLHELGESELPPRSSFARQLVSSAEMSDDVRGHGVPAIRELEIDGLACAAATDDFDDGFGFLVLRLFVTHLLLHNNHRSSVALGECVHISCRLAVWVSYPVARAVATERYSPAAVLLEKMLLA